MPQRRRYATRPEVVELLASRTALPSHIVDDVLQALADEGVLVHQLVKVTTMEELNGTP